MQKRNRKDRKMLRHKIVPERTNIFSIKLYIPETLSKKFIALIHSMKFLSPNVPFYRYQFILPPCSKYCCHAWAGIYTSYLDMYMTVVSIYSKTRNELEPSETGCNHLEQAVTIWNHL